MDYEASRITENTRASYPVEHIEIAQIPCMGGHPKVSLVRRLPCPLARLRVVILLASSSGRPRAGPSHGPQSSLSLHHCPRSAALGPAEHCVFVPGHIRGAAACEPPLARASPLLLHQARASGTPSSSSKCGSGDSLFVLKGQHRGGAFPRTSAADAAAAGTTILSSQTLVARCPAVRHGLPCSGFTAKVAGTEQGVAAPQPTFSPCYTSTSLVFHPVCWAGWRWAVVCALA